jgi:hypothetical protein
MRFHAVTEPIGRLERKVNFACIAQFIPGNTV